MTSGAKNLLFPIETINRELDFRVFLAVRMAAAGHRVFIGQHDVIDRIVPLLRGGVYLGKNVFKGLFPGVSLEHYRRLERHGFHIVHLDEEGAFYPGDAARWRALLDLRLDPRLLSPERDYLCTWGDFQGRHYAERSPALEERIRVTGHPRFDLYKQPYRAYFDAEVDRLRREHGEFVLLNTNLSVANSARGLADAFSARMRMDPNKPAERLWQIDRWAHETRTLADFCQMLGHLSVRFPETRFIVRPHPSESDELYRTVLTHCANVRVIHEGPVGPWLLAARALLHDGCTTAVEAYLAERPIINYRPEAGDPSNVISIPNELGVHCTDWREIGTHLESILRDGEPPTDVKPGEPSEQSTELFRNYRGDAIHGLSEVLKEALGHVGAIRTAPIGDLRRSEARRRVIHAAKAVARVPFPEKRLFARAARRQFYGLDRARIGERLATAKQLERAAVDWTVVSDHLVVVEPER